MLNFILYTWALIPFLTCLTPICALSTSVSVSSPVDPVKKGFVLSILCNVKNIKKNHMVAITRRNTAGDITSFTWGKTVVLDDDDRVFLAIRRQQHDGNSELYLLSIRDVTNTDAGRYSCQVLFNQPGNFTEVAVGTVGVQVHYFPDLDSNPKCSSSEQLNVNAGGRITLNCTSESGFPMVNISWSRTDGRPLPKSTQSIRHGLVISQISFTASAHDDGIMFMCTIASNVFPEISQKSCHSGPLIVKGDWIPSTEVATTRSHLNSATHNTVFDTPQGPMKPKLSSKCLNCSRSSTVSYWILATIAASLLAIIFIICDIMLCYKVWRLSEDTKPKVYQPPPEDLYFEISNRATLRAADPPRRLYMTLEKPYSKGVYASETLCTGL